MKKIFTHWRVLLRDRAYRISLFVGLIVVVSAFLSTMSLGEYLDSVNYQSVGDFILNNIPTYNLEFLFTWGFYVVIALIALYGIRKPEIVPFSLKTYGILLFVRAAFLVLTQVGPPEGFFYEVYQRPDDVFGSFIFRNDLFFSGHTAIPFLAFLLFKGSKFRWVMLFASFVMGATVLLMHVHYSIDVFAAPFITYGVYALSNTIFNNLNLRFKRVLDGYKFQNFKKMIKNTGKRTRERLGMKKGRKGNL